MAKRVMAKRERQCGFAIALSQQREIEERALEKFGEDPDEEFQKLSVEAGFVTKDGSITEAGWAQLQKDMQQAERNALAWLKKHFVGARDEGHDSHDDLIGTLYWNPRSKKQREMIMLGANERIDFDDSSYGGMTTAWDGASGFAIIMTGSITFFDLDIDPHTGEDL